MNHLTSSIKGKIALITGASSGIGKQLALALSSAGASVIIGARRMDKLEELALQIKDSGGNALPVKLDVTSAASINNAVAKAMETFGRIDILVNNAGNILRKNLLDFSEEDFDSIMDTHLKGYWLTSMAVIKDMLKKDLPCNIINISSMAATKSYKSGTVYATAKAGVSHLTHTMAFEFAKQNIRINAIAPGLFITDLNKNEVGTELLSGVVSRIPMGRTGQLHELEAPLLFLASEASSYITGCVLPVDGGYVSNPM